MLHPTYATTAQPYLDVELLEVLLLRGEDAIVECPET
jgi:hypothetical protein